MLRSRIALAAVVLAPLIPGRAFAAYGSRAHADADKKGSCSASSAKELVEVKSSEAKSLEARSAKAKSPHSHHAQLLSTFHIVAVTPYYENETHLKTTTQELRGATLRIQAEPGLTAQWLQYRIERAASSPSERAFNSPLAISGVHAKVSSEPDSFLVTLMAQDKRSAEELLHRAEMLHAGHRAAPRPPFGGQANQGYQGNL